MTEQRPLGPCTTPGDDFVAAWKRNAAKLSSHGLYDPAEEHDACGVGLVASLDGTPRRDVVVAGIEALKAVRSEEHTSELQSLMRISYAVFCLKKKKYIYNANKRE